MDGWKQGGFFKFSDKMSQYLEDAFSGKADDDDYASDSLSRPSHLLSLLGNPGA